VTFTVGGTVTGLTGSGLVLQNNGGDSRTITANGPFNFTTQLVSGAAYAVTIATRPSGPSQACVVGNGSGNVALANVTGISVVCGPAPGKFLYVTAGNPVRLRGYTINASTGALSLINGSTTPSGNNPSWLATNPSEQFLLTANAAPGDISVYSINASTGALSESPGSPFAVGGGPTGMTFRPDGAFLYAPYTSSVAAFSFNATTGVLTPVIGSPYAVGTLPGKPIIEPTGKFIYVPSGGGSGELFGFAIDAATGTLTPVPGSPYAGLRAGVLTLGNAGSVLYVSKYLNNFPDDSSIMAFRIDATTGELTPVNGSPFAAGVAGGKIQLSPDGRFLFVANATNGAALVTSFVVDQNTGALTATPGSSIQIGAGAVNFDVDPSGRYIAAFPALATTATMISINATTGALSGNLMDPFGYTAHAGVLDRSGLFSYVLEYAGDRVYPYGIDPTTFDVVALPFVAVGGVQANQALVVGSQ
jgi:6-phosphogluconolactonase (cycloisomerase 2 family)